MAETAKDSATPQKKSEHPSNSKMYGALAAIFLLPIALFIADALVPSSVWWAHPFLVLLAPRTAADYWVCITAEATLGLAVLAYRGLRSLRLTKHDIMTRVTRDALASTVRQCERFAKEVLAERNNLVKHGPIPVFVTEPEQINFADHNKEHFQKAVEWYAALSHESRSAVSTFLNDVEAWCMHFTSGVADRDFAYGPCATPFLSLIVEFYPVLVVFRNSDRISGKFPNTVNLFEHWRKKRDDGTEKELSDILRRLKQLEGKARKRPPGDLPPTIGTVGPDLDG